MGKTQRSCLVVVVDRWGAGYLGAYGNTWLDTPELNEWASESLLAEQAYADSDSLDRIYRSYWAGRHAADRTAQSDLDRGWLPELAAAGVPSELITDAWEVADHRLAAEFDAKIFLPPDDVSQVVDDPAATHFASLVAATIDRLSDPTPRLMWLHASGAAGPWDAPLDLRAAFGDEGDPEPSASCVAPAWDVPANADPDTWLPWLHAYAGQIATYDLCLGALWDSFLSAELASESLLIFTSPRGLPLGEHGRVGSGGRECHEESLHVPLFVRHPGGAGALTREQSLTQPWDLAATLRDWFDIDPPSRSGGARSLLELTAPDAPSWQARRVALTVGRQFRATRTPSWLWIEGRGAEPERADDTTGELYKKPDDRWEINELSRRCPELADELRGLTTECAERLGGDESERLPVPSDSAWEAWE